MWTFSSEGRATIPPMPEIVTAALVREGQVLIVHRSPNRHVHPDVWDLPGGHIDAGETELAALAREMIRWFRPDELPPLIHEPVRTALVEAMRGART